jgi:hypothetical protein
MNERVAIRTSEWWALVDDLGDVRFVSGDEEACKDWLVGNWITDESVEHRWTRYEAVGWSIRRVIVQAPEVDR